MDEQFQPISYDLVGNTPESNPVIGDLVGGRIKILELIQCDPPFFEAVEREVMELLSKRKGYSLDTGHPTFDYIRKWDPRWKPEPDTVTQYSLFNTRNDIVFFEEDHHWFPDRQFNSMLTEIPNFYERYFGDSELQNFRVQAVAGGGGLGQHRERIVAIPKRESHYKLRFHLPILTNPDVTFLMDGESFHMEAGWIYLFNQACLHGVSNQGDAMRIHLVWDCYLNDYIISRLIVPALNRKYV